MKTSPFVRIRQKNKELKLIEQSFKELADLLSCKPMVLDMKDAIVEALSWRGEYMKAMSDNDQLRVKMGAMVADQVEKTTFDSQLKAQKLQLEVDRLNRIIDTKDNDMQKYQNKLSGKEKGFWDFMYRVFKLV